MREIKAGDELLYTTASSTKYKFLITKIELDGDIHFNYFRVDGSGHKDATYWSNVSFKAAFKQGSLLFLNQILIEDDPEYSELFI